MPCRVVVCGYARQSVVVSLRSGLRLNNNKTQNVKNTHNEERLPDTSNKFNTIKGKSGKQQSLMGGIKIIEGQAFPVSGCY